MDKTLSDAIDVAIRLRRAQGAYGVTADNQEVGLDELNSAFDAYEAFAEELREGGHSIDMGLAQAVAIEVTTGKQNSYIQRDAEGNPVALVEPRNLSDKQLARARELLDDPRQTITSVAKDLGGSPSPTYGSGIR
ncbi:hypothetical protein ACIHIX_39575 [Streptomyces sp. NPDC051913]|uniref:hypothetical protein n=1 Tax=Streptomyces sp. NPDC051913 TaxID=3365676 RepID=UPI0037D5C417